MPPKFDKMKNSDSFRHVAVKKSLVLKKIRKGKNLKQLFLLIYLFKQIHIHHLSALIPSYLGRCNTSSSTLLYTPSWHHPLLSLTYHSLHSASIFSLAFLFLSIHPHSYPSLFQSHACHFSSSRVHTKHLFKQIIVHNWNSILISAVARGKLSPAVLDDLIANVKSMDTMSVAKQKISRGKLNMYKNEIRFHLDNAFNYHTTSLNYSALVLSYCHLAATCHPEKIVAPTSLRLRLPPQRSLLLRLIGTRHCHFTIFIL